MAKVELRAYPNNPLYCGRLQSPMAGKRIAKSKAMMEITTKSSISVKPATFLVFGLCAVMVGGKIILEKKKYNSKIIETRVEIVS